MAGTMAGGLVRIVNLIWVCNCKVLNIPIWSVIKNYILYLGVSCGIVLFATKVVRFECVSLVKLICIAIPVLSVVSVFILIVSLIFNRKQFLSVMKYMRQKL